jgi:hypothetical protein
MPVPEAAIYKNYGFVFGQNNIGFSGQGFNIQPVTKTICKQKLPHQQFWLCIFAF